MTERQDKLNGGGQSPSTAAPLASDGGIVVLVDGGDKDAADKEIEAASNSNSSSSAAIASVSAPPAQIIEAEKEKEAEVQPEVEVEAEAETEADRDRDSHGDRSTHKDEFGTQRVYKKTSPNCVLTLYLPTREITLTGNSPSILRGIVFVDPKAIQGYRVYAQLTLTFRYGREDEEVMGLRFCNEAIMSLHQIWPRNEQPSGESLSPLQEALVKRLGDGAHPFTLSLTTQAPPSVQLVPAKRYYGAPIGTSYDVRCFIDKTDEKFHRRASVKMGVRVIYRTDVFQQHIGPAEHFASLINSATQHTQSPPMSATPPLASDSSGAPEQQQQPSVKPKSKSERGDSFPKLRLSPKSFRFSGRFGRSKSEVEKCPNDPFHNYSKSFQEQGDGSGMLPPSSGAGVTGGIGGISVGPCGGPQGAVDKPFLLQDGRVGLRASLDKAWYTHGEEVNVTVNIRNDSRKTVRKVRVCAIQHVDVCMFNNGKFKNVVADSDTASPAVDRTVAPGASLHTTVALRPQRGPTKNWIALEDTLQRSTEPDEITGAIAASAIRAPNFVLHSQQLLASNLCSSPAIALPQPPAPPPAATSSSTAAAGGSAAASGAVSSDDRNVFAIYVSYYVKVKLTLSGMGGELSLKLPFVLVHVDEGLRSGYGYGHASATLSELRMEKLALHDVPASRKNGAKQRSATLSDDAPSTSAAAAAAATAKVGLDRIESADDEFNIRVPVPPAALAMQRNGSHKRRLMRSETLARDEDLAEDEAEEGGVDKPPAAEQLHVVQVHQQQHQKTEREGDSESESKSKIESGAVPKTPNV